MGNPVSRATSTAGKVLLQRQQRLIRQLFGGGQHLTVRVERTLRGMRL
ncbi:hypothetical protein [Pseudomonas sp. 2FE]|nr:hypothetical protein [Pseudomonas sp. 2FE]